MSYRQAMRGPRSPWNVDLFAPTAAEVAAYRAAHRCTRLAARRGARRERFEAAVAHGRWLAERQDGAPGYYAALSYLASFAPRRVIDSARATE